MLFAETSRVISLTGSPRAADLGETGRAPILSSRETGQEIHIGQLASLASCKFRIEPTEDPVLTFAKAEDDSSRDLQIVERLTAGHDAAGDACDIAERGFVMADLVAHVEPEGEPLREEVLQAAAEVAREDRLAAVGACVHEVGVQLSWLIVIAECNFVSRATRTRRDVWYPFRPDCGEVVNIVGGERNWIGNAELSRIMTVEVVTHASANGSARIYV